MIHGQPIGAGHLYNIVVVVEMKCAIDANDIVGAVVSGIVNIVIVRITAVVIITTVARHIDRIIGILLE